MWQNKLKLIVSLSGVIFPLTSFGSVLPMIVKAQGQVLVQEKVDEDGRAAGIGWQLSRNNFVKLSGVSQAAIICPDFTLVSVPSGNARNVSHLCGERVTTRRFRADEVLETMLGGSNSLIPYIISPVSIRTSVPETVEWNPVAGASSYTVEILDSNDGVVVDRNTGSTAITLTDSEKVKLKDGKDYSVWVVSNNGKNSDDDKRGETGFRISPLEDSRSLRDSVNTIRLSALIRAEEKAIVLAELYDSEGYLDEAIGTLKQVQSIASSAYIDRKLGDLYAKAGLNLLSQASYQNARSRAIARENSYELERVQNGLQAVAGNIDIGGAEVVPAALEQ